MATKQNTTRAKQREAWKAERAAEKAREERRRKLTIGAVVASVVVIFGAVAALALTSGGGSPKTDASGTAYSATKTAFRLPGLVDQSKTVSLAGLAGTPVVVNFFASWCVYCNEELPGFVQVAKAGDGKVAFVGVDTSDPGDGAAMAARFDLAGAGFSLAKDIGGNPPSQLWSSFGSQGLPVTAFYDATGKLVDFSGGMLTQAELEQRIQKNFGVDIKGQDAAQLGAPVIPLIPQGAYELLKNHPGVDAITPVDVRSAGEFATGHVAGAVNLPYGSGFAGQAARLDTAGSYILYDASGADAETAAKTLHDAGFKHVYYVQGGYAAWTQQGLPTS